MGVATGGGGLLTTQPYYHSTYALVYVRGRGLDDVSSGAQFAALPDERKQKLKVGIFAPTPAAEWLAGHGMTNQTVAHPVMSGDPAAYPGQLIEQDLIGKQVDAVVIWGPIAGYYAQQSRRRAGRHPSRVGAARRCSTSASPSAFVSRTRTARTSCRA
jgi:ABC-type amino acid transport substrate-binding protein